MDDKDFREIIDLDEDTAEETVDAVEEKQEDTEQDDYESMCVLCHRPESKTGKQITLAPGISICPECMQKTMDMMHGPDMDLTNMPDMSKMSDMSKMPNVSFINLADLQNLFPQQQKVKKKKAKADEKPAIDIKNIPVPHKITETN